MKKSHGFTLLEILVVITLILIIAGIAIPRFAGVSDEGRRSKAAAELRTLQTALESYVLKSNVLPGDAGAVVTALTTPLENANPRLVGNVADFKDPFTNNLPYKYDIDTNSRYYVIWSIGPDRASDITGIGTNGDIAPASPDDDIFVTNGQTQ